MAITNGYVTAAQLTAWMAPTGPAAGDTTEVERAIEAACREIDAYCGRSFYAVTDADNPRTFRAAYADEVDIDDCHGTAIVVKVDAGNTGTFGTTLVEGTDYVLDPPGNRTRNGAYRPYSRLVSLGYSFPTYGPRARIEVTPAGGTFGWGWPTVPTEVEQAALLVSAHIWRRNRSPDGWIETVESTVRVSRYLDNDAAQLLDPFVLDPVRF